MHGSDNLVLLHNLEKKKEENTIFKEYKTTIGIITSYLKIKKNNFVLAI